MSNDVQDYSDVEAILSMMAAGMDDDEMESYGGPVNDQPADMFVSDIEEEVQKNETHQYTNDPDPIPTDPSFKPDDWFEPFMLINTKKRVHKYTEQEMKQIDESCKGVIVRDFLKDDPYHMPDEERAKIDRLRSIREELGTVRSMYRRIDEYIEAMRIVVRAWEIYAEDNEIHTEREFFEMVAEGTITSPNIIMPHMKKLDRYNKDLVMMYISNPELDPKDLLPDSQKDGLYDSMIIDPELDEIERMFDEQLEDEATKGFYDSADDVISNLARYLQEDEEEQSEEQKEAERKRKEREEEIQRKKEEAIERMTRARTNRLLTPEEQAYLVDTIDNPPEYQAKEISRSLIKGYDDRSFIMRKKGKRKKGNKVWRYKRQNLHLMLNTIQTALNKTNMNNRNREYYLTHSMFDLGKPEVDINDQLYLKGSLQSEAVDQVYDMMFGEELRNKPIPGSNGRLTLADKEFRDFQESLDKNGYNTIEILRIMQMTPEDMKTTKDKESKKQNRKMEAAIVQRITELNNDPKFKKLVKKIEGDYTEYTEKGSAGDD